MGRAERRKHGKHVGRVKQAAAAASGGGPDIVESADPMIGMHAGPLHGMPDPVSVSLPKYGRVNAHVGMQFRDLISQGFSRQIAQQQPDYPFYRGTVFDYQLEGTNMDVDIPTHAMISFDLTNEHDTDYMYLDDVNWLFNYITDQPNDSDPKDWWYSRHMWEAKYVYNTRENADKIACLEGLKPFGSYMNYFTNNADLTDLYTNNNAGIKSRPMALLPDFNKDEGILMIAPGETKTLYFSLDFLPFFQGRFPWPAISKGSNGSWKYRIRIYPRSSDGIFPRTPTTWLEKEGATTSLPTRTVTGETGSLGIGICRDRQKMKTTNWQIWITGDQLPPGYREQVLSDYSKVAFNCLSPVRHYVTCSGVQTGELGEMRELTSFIGDIACINAYLLPLNAEDQAPPLSGLTASLSWANGSKRDYAEMESLTLWAAGGHAIDVQDADSELLSSQREHVYETPWLREVGKQYGQIACENPELIPKEGILYHVTRRPRVLSYSFCKNMVAAHYGGENTGAMRLNGNWQAQIRYGKNHLGNDFAGTEQASAYYTAYRYQTRVYDGREWQQDLH